MEIYRIEDLSFTYPDRDKKALEKINLSINAGEFVCICGKSGCGKTTLLRLLKSHLAPHGIQSGNILFEGKRAQEIDSRTQVAKIGFVMQNVENQIVTDKVWHELAFGLESLGVPNNEIRTRVSEMASFFGIGEWFYKNVTELSGGQKQLLNLASVMIMQPSVLILDEPTSQLDPIAASEFLKTLKKINDEFGTTIILCEHRLEEAFQLSDRVIVMDEGGIIADDKPNAVGKVLKDKNHDMYISLPTPIKVYESVDGGGNSPVTVREGRIWLEDFSRKNTLRKDLIPKEEIECSDKPCIEVKSAFFRYEKEMPDVIKNLNLKVNEGGIFSVLGGNGNGKTTALSLISGVNTPYRGEVLIQGKKIEEIKNLYGEVLAVLPQDPQSLFTKKTVYLDLLDTLSDEKDRDTKAGTLNALVELCNITDILHSHPYDLSGGEIQRAALCKVLLKNPQIILLDEPTKGLDSHFKKIFADILYDLKANGKTVVIVSHDIEFCAEVSDRCAMFFDGGITSVASGRKFFAGNSFYTTAANRMARGVLPEAISVNDIILACGKEAYEVRKEKTRTNLQLFPQDTKIKKEEGKKTQGKKTEKRTKLPLSKRTLFSMLFILILLPITMYFGIGYLGDRKYYFVSMLIILQTMIWFFLSFEGKKPRPREIVVISVLCAIAVCSRAAFYMIPQFKPVMAIIILSGVCFGGETGFLVGAITAFVSNFFFGQGPWTPWQMFAFGTVGFVSGILFEKRPLVKTKVFLSIYGFFATIIIFGGIVNPSHVIMSQPHINWGAILTTYAMGLPFDLIHASSTAIFLWFISEPMLEKLERIKIKYGLIL